ncbi:hypothetical protein [Sphingomonas sp.]|jgi:hypothetical protein|uniref:hypothetical protein n=1 Tax=Sphingomonas sp. TaxID=28214 RepID=UPI002DF3FD58|nr:hypothetical protein [Sphingomonas sp.]
MDLKGNLSTEHQLAGDAKRPDSATLDKNRTPEDEGSDRGQRPFIAGNGEVRGSGAGAGGGNLREDYDDEQASGGGDLTRGSGQDEERRQNHEAVHNGNRLSEAGAHDGVEDQIHKAVDNQSSVSPDDYPEKNSMGHADKG